MPARTIGGHVAIEGPGKRTIQSPGPADKTNAINDERSSPAKSSSHWFRMFWEYTWQLFLELSI